MDDHETEWEPHWRFSGSPSLGDYVQLHVENQQGITIFPEGLVTRVEGVWIWLNGETTSDNEGTVVCWRRRVLLSPTSQTREAERVA